MRISTRSRYGVRLMINLAANYNKRNVFLKDIAKEEEISEKYLSQIVIPLRRAGLISASRGVHGGYTLAKLPRAITAKDVVEALEGDLDLIECAREQDACNRVAGCASRGLWEGLSRKITEYLNSVTLGELLKIKQEKVSKTIEYSI
ncbi:MAG TPA: Rrf2 family transcriptional regulator [Candidatus Humimicrobiaceae bacterium]